MIEFLIDFHDTAPRWKETSRVVNPNRKSDRSVTFIDDIEHGYESFVLKTVEDQQSDYPIKKEFDSLVRLRHSGVTPIPYHYEYNPISKKATLLMQQLPGVTLETNVKTEEIARNKFPMLFTSLLSSLKTINSQHEVLGDINEGMFLFDDNKTYIVDLEQCSLIKGIDTMYKQHPYERERWIYYNGWNNPFAAEIDPGDASQFSEELLIKQQNYEATRVLVDHFFRKDILAFDIQTLHESEKNNFHYLMKTTFVEGYNRYTKTLERDDDSGHLALEDSYSYAIKAPIVLPHLLNSAHISTSDQELIRLQNILLFK